MPESSSFGESRRIVAKSRHDDIALFESTVTSAEDVARFRSAHEGPDTIIAFEDEDEDEDELV